MGRTALIIGVIAIVIGLAAVLAGIYSGLGIVGFGVIRLIHAYLAHAEEQEIDHRE